MNSVHITDVAAWCGITFWSYKANPLYYAKHLYLNGEKVEHLVIPEGVERITRYAFYGFDDLTSITVPASIKIIDFNSFSDCKNLSIIDVTDLTSWCENIHLQNRISNNWSLYYQGKEVKDLVIPQGTTRILGSFLLCSNLTSITIPNSVTSIGDYAFYGCSAVTSLTFHCREILPSFKSLGKQIKEVVIGDEVTTIPANAFFDWSSLTSVTIGNSVTSIGDNAFNSCSGLPSITIPNSVTSIGEGAFKNCSSLTSITLPKKMPVIGGYAFDNTPWFDNQPDGLVYFGTVAYKYKGKMPENTSITIKEGTLALASGVFSGCWGLTSITIPNSVTSIGTYAFESCSGLTSIEIPNSVTSIGWLAFYGCTNLTSITIPISVTTIGIGAFSLCTSLSKVTSLIQVPFAIVNVFPNEVYENATLYVPLGTMESYMNTEGWNNFDLYG